MCNSKLYLQCECKTNTSSGTADDKGVNSDNPVQMNELLSYHLLKDINAPKNLEVVYSDQSICGAAK